MICDGDFDGDSEQKWINDVDGGNLDFSKQFDRSFCRWEYKEAFSITTLCSTSLKEKELEFVGMRREEGDAV